MKTKESIILGRWGYWRSPEASPQGEGTMVNQVPLNRNSELKSNVFNSYYS